MTRKPPSETSTPDAGSRRDRLGARRNRRIRIIVAVVVVAIAGAVAVAAYALNDGDPLAHAVAPNPKSTKFGVEGTLVAPNAKKAPAPRRLDHAHPLRLWIGGDSLAGSFGPALGDRVGATGIVQTVIDYRVSSGLWSNDLRNWYQRATDQMASADPEAVVFMIGANDTPVVNQVDANRDGVPDWQAEYRMKVARMMDVLVGPKHRAVIWLGPPTIGSMQSLDAGAKAIGQVMREEAAKRAPDVVYVDTYKLFSGADGSYSRRIIDETGKEIVARIGDGVHFSADGAQYLARAVFTLVDTRWQLSKQADLAEPIGWTLAPGSGEAVPGFSSAPRSRYRPRNRTTGTTAPSTPSTFAEPSTAAPTTVAPTTSPPTVPQTTAPRVTVPPTTVHVTPTT